MKSENIKMDEIMKLLFSVSQKVLVNMMAGLFDEKTEIGEKLNRSNRINFY